MLNTKCLGLLSLTMLLGCAAHQVQYIDPMDARSTSAGLSHADFKRMSQDIVSQMLDDVALDARLPDRSVLLLGSIKNRTYDHLDGMAFGQILRQSMRSTQRFAFVDQERLDDLLDQWELRRTGLVEKDHAMKAGALLNARYICFASVSSTYQRGGRVKDVSYMLSLELTDVSNGEILWTGQTDIRKMQKQARFGI